MTHDDRPAPHRDLPRRTVLRGGAAALAGSALGPALAQENARAQEPAHEANRGRTAVVVGSGFGGSVAALRLGQAGYRVIVLERGRRWRTDDDPNTFPSLIAPDGRAAWFSDIPHINQLSRGFVIKRYPGLVDRIFGRGIDAVFGAGVGGGSLVFGTFMPQPRRREWDPLLPADMGYDEMDRTWFPLAKRELGISPLPDDLLALPQWKGARAWIDTVRDFGTELVRHDFAIDWDKVRDEVSGRRRPSVSIGEYVYGANSGAKLSLDRTYLPRAEATGNVEIRELSEVVDVAELPDGRLEVTAIRIDEDRREIGRTTEAADLVVMAAGAFHTPALLTRLKAQGRLPRLPEATGKGYGSNGDFLAIQTFLRHDVGDLQGGPGVGVMYDDANPYGPSTISWEAAPLPRHTGGFTTTNLLQVTTSQRGSIDYDVREGRSVLSYPHLENGETETELLGRHAVGRFKQLAHDRHGFPASGVPVWTRVADMGSGTTWHSLGGMVMDGARFHGGAPGAVDASGRVHGYPNLLVMDASVLPGAAGLVNPALTITAIAERIVHRFLAGE